MGDSSKYGYTSLNYKNCCPISKPIIKTIIVSCPESQHILKLNSCCTLFKPSTKKGTNQHESYDRVLRRRRGQALNQK